MQKTTLPSGLRVITQSLPGTDSLTCLVLVGAGSRYETKEENGIAHFLEHMFFKGGKEFPKPKDVAEAIDAVGGDFNAFTGKEYAGYYVKVAAAKADTAYRVLSDMMLHATFPAEEIEKERGVILEEYNMYQDMPMYQVGWNFEELLYGDQPMGWDQLGPPANIKKFQREDFVSFKEELYQPENIVISVAGNCEHNAVVAEIEKYFAFETAEREATNWLPLADWNMASRLTIQNKKTEQGHLILGVPGVSHEDERYSVQRVLATILGGNMSSRMFLTVREEKGLCYTVRTSTDDYLDSGVLSTYAGVTLDKLPLAVAAIREEYEKMSADGVTAAELQKAKDYLKGKMTLRLEDSESYANLLASQHLLYSEQKTIEQIFAEIDAVTAEQIQILAKEIFQPSELRLAVIGPFEEKKEELEALLK